MDLNEAKKLSKKESKRKKEKNKHKKKRKRTSGDWEEHSRKRKRHRSYNSSEGFKNKGIRHDSAERSDSSEQLQKLRRERMQREEMEKKKTFDLLHPLKEQAKSEDINPKYSSQFNPALARQNRFRWQSRFMHVKFMQWGFDFAVVICIQVVFKWCEVNKWCKHVLCSLRCMSTLCGSHFSVCEWKGCNLVHKGRRNGVLSRRGEKKCWLATDVLVFIQIGSFEIVYWFRFSTWYK